MIHVLNPYQLSTSMFRLAAFTFEAQLSFMRAFTHLSTHANPAFVTREAILAKAEKDAVKGPVTKKIATPKTPAKPALVAKAETPVKAAPKKTARKAAPTAKTEATQTKPPVAKQTAAKQPVAKTTTAATTRAKTAAPKAAPTPAPKLAAKTATKTAAKPVPAANDESKTYRAPSKPPAMPGMDDGKG
ncbi:hypothetical protein [Thalassovita sp.]|jgi:hypothetical protein|uniref:hypothetical protein n=1 Tax=Thalassovita sp. TaxID=1979401 RepID=UPI003B5CEDE1